VPTAGNDLTLIGLLAAAGVVFGLFGGLLTWVRGKSGNVYIKATLPAVALWVVSMGFRIGLDVWSSYGSGVRHLATFSIAHQITSREAWTTALVLMAFGELAYGLSIMATSGTAIGLVAGVGAWALADRSVEHAAFRAEHDRALVLLAEVEASRHAQREAAAAQERNRIAGEMHDVLAHSLAGFPCSCRRSGPWRPRRAPGRRVPPSVRCAGRGFAAWQTSKDWSTGSRARSASVLTDSQGASTPRPAMPSTGRSRRP
jgi:hypothetical protein